MRIAITTRAPFVAGAEVAAERLALGLLNAGHDVLMIAGVEGAAVERFRDGGIDCSVVPMVQDNKWTWWRTTRMRRLLERTLSEFAPDVLHANDLPTSQMVSKTAAKLGIPRICHHRWKFDGRAVDWLNKYGAETHLFVSRFLMDSLCDSASSLNRSDCRTVYDGLQLGEPSGPLDRQAARERLALRHDPVIVLLAGQVIERKGIADAIRAWSMLSDDILQRAELHVVGDDLANQGAYRREMESLADDLAAKARFHGYRNDIPDWLAACDIALVPSHDEPLGNATLEAMAASRPVIGARVGGIPELIIDNETGLLVEPRTPRALANQIMRLLEDATLRKQLGRSARSRCERFFSIEAHVQATAAAYHTVLRKRHRKTA